MVDNRIDWKMMYGRRSWKARYKKPEKVERPEKPEPERKPRGFLEALLNGPDKKKR